MCVHAYAVLHIRHLHPLKNNDLWECIILVFIVTPFVRAVAQGIAIRKKKSRI